MAIISNTVNVSTPKKYETIQLNDRINVYMNYVKNTFIVYEYDPHFKVVLINNVGSLSNLKLDAGFYRGIKT